jgi:transcriptional regulator with XRE-family HTH domain
MMTYIDIRIHMLKHGVTLNQVARAVGLGSRGAACNVLKGKRPGSEHYDKAMAFLGLKINTKGKEKKNATNNAKRKASRRGRLRAAKRNQMRQ